jgi:hypothetical protein
MQTLHLTETSKLTDITGDIIRKLQNKASWRVDEIFAYTTKDSQYKFLLENHELIKMIDEYPYLWLNLQFKLKAYINTIGKINPLEDTNGEIINAKAHLTDELIKIFMKPSIHNPLSGKSSSHIRTTITDTMVNNVALFLYIWEHTANSFIEYSNAKLCKLSSIQIGWLLGKITERTTNEWNEAIDHFNEIFMEIIGYIQDIFHINMYDTLPFLKSIHSFKNFDHLGVSLKEEMEKWGIHYRNATLLMKTIYAWGHLTRIKETQKEAFEARDNLIKYLNKPHGKCAELGTLENKNWDLQNRNKSFIYTFTFSNGTQKDIKIDTRIKGIESILIKLFADEHYGDIDAVNDTLWIRMALWQLDPHEKVEIIAYFWGLMGKNSAIFKNKKNLDQKEFDELKTRWANTDSNPIGIESKLKTRSNQWYRDCKYSGYIRKEIHEKQIGTEIQFFDNEEEVDPLGHANHSILDAKKIIQWWYRSTHIITGQQIAEVLYKRCFDNQWKSISWLSFEEIFTDIYISLLAPYGYEESEGIQMAFAIQGYEEYLQEEYPSMKKLKPKNHKNITQYVEVLFKKFKNNPKRHA